MLRHAVLIWTTEDSTATQQDALIAGLAALPNTIEAIGTYVMGRDEGISPGAPDISLMATFDDVGAFNAYRQHADHVAAVRDLLEPICDRRVSTQLLTPT